MTEHTPTEDEVREEWAYGAQDLDMDGNVVVSLDEGFAQFDRFIATVKADAWDEGYEAAARYHDLDTEFAAPNPYREETHE